MTDIFVTPSPVVGAHDAPSAVSWGAIIAGAFAAAAFSLALIALGAGIGLASVSPWSGSSVSAKTFGLLAALWLIATQLFACGLGGYLAGRLRTRWTHAHVDEVYFRDTAHGLVVWAVSAMLAAFVLASAGGALTRGLASASTQSASALADAYLTDTLFRGDHPQAQGDDAASRTEIGRILTHSLAAGKMSAADQTYAAQVVAAKTGLSPADAQKRLTQVEDEAKAAADAARKTGVYVAMWIFIALLVGAFSASYMAMVGGEVRDESPLAE